jgi:hypothetical protein
MYLLLFIDKCALYIDIDASFLDTQGGTSVNFISRQAAIGAFTAAALMLGANASPDIRPGAPSHSALSIGAQLTRSYQGAGATLAEVFRTYRDEVLDDALDAFGEISARLRQL